MRRAKARSRRGGRRLTVPERAHPLVRLMFQEMQLQGVEYATLERASGVAAKAMVTWRSGRVPRLDNLEACLAALGLALVVKRQQKP